MATVTDIQQPDAEPADRPETPTDWTLDIGPRRGMFQVPLAEIWRYRDLLYLLVRRDFVAFYKQTILGPLWFLIQPILTTLMFTLVFGRIAGISTDGAPAILFYLAGVTLWGYFAECLNKTATTFTDNAALFGKVYFPRMIAPLAVVVSNLMKLSIQLCLFLAFLGYYIATGQANPNTFALLLPFLIVVLAAISLGFGLIFSAMTTKYRDLKFLLSFGVQLAMYITPIIYPVSSIPEKYATLIRLNPLTPLVETFRYGFLGVGDFTTGGLVYASLFAVGILSIGVLIFNRVEATFMDTV